MDLQILEIASNTKNNKNIKNHTHYSKLKNPLCGDEIQIKLVMKDDKIINFGYQGSFCVYCQASASLLSKISINNSKHKLNELCNDVKSYFNGNLKNIEDKCRTFKKLLKKENLLRKECILLPFKALEKIIKN